MEIFKYRNLALACFGFAITLFLSYNMSCGILYFTAVLPAALIFIGIILHLIFKNGFFKAMLIKYTPLCLFVTLAVLISLFVFKRDIQTAAFYCDEEEKEAYMQIYDVRYTQDNMGIYLADVKSVGGNDVNFRTLLFTSDKELEIGDCLIANGIFSELEETSVGFSERDTYLEYGVVNSFDASSYKFSSSNKNIFLDFFNRVNAFLSDRLENNTNSTTSPILSALFLGNRALLEDSVARDFSRIGISHILSLSGMHLAILIGALELLLSKLRLSKITNYLILSFSVFFYISLTGFALSCLRAGLMILLVYTCELLSSRLNRLTSLFVAVTLICSFNPYCIFSTSLQLSFLAMLACFIASRYIYKSRLRHTHGRGKRYLLFTFITSCFVIFFTLPIIYSRFGMIALLSPVSNILLVPVFSLLIYLAPLVLLLCDIPFISSFIVFITEKLTDGSLFIVSKLADIEKTMLPIKNGVQVFGIILIFGSMIFLIFLSKKHIRKLIVTASLGIAIVFIGSSYLLIERGNNKYVGVYSFTGNDLIFYEENNTLSIIDITKSTISTASYSRNLSSSLGYGEIEEYVITSYSDHTLEYFKRLIGQIKIKTIYLPTPSDNGEISLFCKLVELARSEGVSLKALDEEISILGSKILFEITKQERSLRKSVSLLMQAGNGYFSYIGSGCFELVSQTPTRFASVADILIFGSFGPTYQEKFNYNVPYLDYCVFLGKSIEYASTDLILNTMPYTVLYEKEPLRFRLP